MFYKRLKTICDERHITPTKVVKDLGLSTSKVTAWKNGTNPKADIILKIADYLDCSVDYLLGRESHRSVSVENIHDNVGVVGQANAPVTIHNGTERQLTTHEKDLLRIYNECDGRKQMKLMQFAYQLEEEI